MRNFTNIEDELVKDLLMLIARASTKGSGR